MERMKYPPVTLSHRDRVRVNDERFPDFWANDACGSASGHVRRRLRRCLLLVLMPCVLACAQVADAGDPNVRIGGDTSGLPRWCKPSAAVEAIQIWFRAVATGDTRLIAGARRAVLAENPRQMLKKPQSSTTIRLRRGFVFPSLSQDCAYGRRSPWLLDPAVRNGVEAHQLPPRRTRHRGVLVAPCSGGIARASSP